MLQVHYFVGGRLLLIDVGEAPRRGDEMAFEGRIYEAVRVVWHRPMCPPDCVHVHLEQRLAEEIDPSASFAAQCLASRVAVGGSSIEQISHAFAASNRKG